MSVSSEISLLDIDFHPDSEEILEKHLAFLEEQYSELYFSVEVVVDRIWAGEEVVLKPEQEAIFEELNRLANEIRDVEDLLDESSISV